MASTLTHLAIAQEYTRKNPELVKNLQEFYDGVIIPDLTSDKDFTHYLDGKVWQSDTMRYIKEPTDLEKFIIYDPLEKDFNLGNLLHLYTDEVYYRKMFRNQDMQNTTLQEFRGKHGQTMDAHDSFIREQYGTSFALTSPEIENTLTDNLARYRENNPIQDGYDPNELLFSQQDLQIFIEETSSVDLHAIIQQVKQKTALQRQSIDEPQNQL
ncbi:MAG: hypothetical protein FWE45_04785 [Firmicutes bacterium]|nr:hypothetical protein [Bacillota bacterium]